MRPQIKHKIAPIAVRKPQEQTHDTSSSQIPQRENFLINQTITQPTINYPHGRWVFLPCNNGDDHRPASHWNDHHRHPVPSQPKAGVFFNLPHSVSGLDWFPTVPRRRRKNFNMSDPFRTFHSSSFRKVLSENKNTQTEELENGTMTDTFPGCF